MDFSLQNPGGCRQGYPRRIRFIMKVSALYVLMITSAAMVQAHDIFGQGLESRVTIGLEQETIKALFQKIKQQTGLSVAYTNNDIDKFPPITLKKEDFTVKEVLDGVLQGTNLIYTLKGKTIIIHQVDTPKQIDDPDLNINLTNETSVNEVAVISGIVKDASTQEPLAGVNVIVKGTTRGTATDAEGRFSISAESEETLVFSFIGYKTFETSVGSQSAINVTMEIDALSLKEVEVRSTGYWTDTKEKSTGNISKVSAKEIENQPVTNPLMALQGRMPGVDITPINGAPGSVVKIQIRGQNSLRFDGGYPLYVIDGVPIDSRPLQSASNSLFDNGFDPLTTINPENIESIEVLKDAEATSIYGSRGANGVVRITTKHRINPGKTSLTANFYQGVGKIPHMVDLLNTKEYVQMRKEAYANDGVTPFGYAARDLLQWDTTRNTNWQKELLGGSAKITDAQLALSGGNSNTTFTFGGGYHKENVVYSGDFGFERLSGNFSLNHFSSDKKFNANVSVNYGSTNNKMFDDLNFISYALNLPPNAPKLYNENGELNWEHGPDGFGTWTNPISFLKRTHDSNTATLVANSVLSYEVLPGLSVKLNAGFTELNGKEHIKNPISSNDPALISNYSTGSSTFGSNHRRSWILEPQAVYTKEIGNHHFDAVIGTTWQESKAEYNSVVGTGYNSDALLNTIKGAATTTNNTDESQYRYNAFFARLGYNWGEKYLLSLSGRKDGSSRFGPGKQFGTFGAISAGWIFSKESFIENNGILSFGKLRGSFGTTGNDGIGDYQYYNTYSITQYQYQGGVGLHPSALFNPDFAWEKTKKLEGGIELGFLENRITLEASWYRNRSSNQLVDYQLPATTGFPSVLTNFNAVIENSGWEFLLTTINVNNGNFRWSTSLNFTVPQNKLVEFDGLEESSYATFYKIGEPLSIQRLFVWKDINPETGLHELVDKNEDGNYDDADMEFMKPTGRKYYGGLYNSVRYKGIEVSFLIQFSKQDAFVLPPTLPGYYGQQNVDVLNRWQEEGDITNIGMYSQRSANRSFFGNYIRYSDYSIRDVSFLRLKTISISYRFPSRLIENLKLAEARVFVYAQNLLTITGNDKVLDPETINSLPPLRMISVGAQVKF